MASNSRNMSL